MASTVLPVHIIAALPNTIILVVADADAVVAAQVNTRVHIGGPVISTLELVEVGVVLETAASATERPLRRRPRSASAVALRRGLIAAARARRGPRSAACTGNQRKM